MFLAVVFAFFSTGFAAAGAGKLLFYGDFENREFTKTPAFISLTDYYIRLITSSLYLHDDEEYDGYYVESLLPESGSKCIDYYVASPDGAVYSNAKKAAFQNIGKQDLYLSFHDGKLKYKGLEEVFGKVRHTYFSTVHSNGFRQEFEEIAAGCEIYLIFHPFEHGGIYSNLYQCYNDFSRIQPLAFFAFSLILLAAAVVFVVAYARLCGHSANSDEISLAFTDKIPTDIHWLLSTAFMLLFAFGAVVSCVYGLSLLDRNASLIRFAGSVLFTRSVYVICSLCGALSFLFFALWVSSVKRIKASGRSFFASFLIAYLIRFIILIGRRTVQSIHRFLAALTYKPKKFKRLVLFAVMAAALITAGLVDLLALLIYEGEEDFAFFTMLLLLALFTAAAYSVLRYMIALDKIILAAQQHRQPELKMKKLPETLKCLTSILAVTNTELERAIEKALHDERMKTELITNVSHDLKTPLTSIISYVDLLGRCEIKDEEAKKYIAVLEEKSARLKTLVEDLVEASKASSGAVTLNKTCLDLRELVTQALGEMSDDFAACLFDLVFNETSQSPAVYADSQKTYRIIENLLSNARKYSIPGSRVYISVGEVDGFGYLQVKNTSKQMLNISPDELTERFVRGDSSRTDGGSGLGLAIAKDLCALQDGKLKIEIDGDLFKATVTLPIYAKS